MADTRVDSIKIMVKSIEKQIVQNTNYILTGKVPSVLNLSYSATMTSDESGLTVEFPSRTSLKQLANSDSEALKRLQLTQVAMCNSWGGYGSCKLTLSDGQVFTRNPNGHGLTAVNFNLFAQKIGKVDLVFENSQPKKLCGMRFYDESNKLLGQTGYIYGAVKTIELEEGERIIGFRAAPGDANSFCNFQFVLAKSN